MRILLKKGRIYDGTGADAFVGDILVEDERIVAVGDDLREEADQVIDLTGLSVSSGFFDAHSHNDWFAIKKEPLKYLEPFIRQGITSFITGNCGLSAVGFEPDSPYVDKVGGGLFGYRGDTTGVYPSVKDFFEAIDRKNPCNMAVIVGHCTARTSVAGWEHRELSASERERMLALMEKGLQEGACGLSLGMMYEPGRFSSVAETRDVALLAEKYDRPLTIHPRAESAVSMDYPLLGRAHILWALDELREMSRGTHMKLQYSHAIFVGRSTFKYRDEVHRILDEMKSEGIDAQFDIYNELLGVSVITVILPAWYQALSSAEKRKPWNKGRFAVLAWASIQLLGFGWKDIIIDYVGEGNEKYEGKTVYQIAKESGKSCIDTYLDLCEMSGFKGRVNMGPYSTPEIIAWQSKRDDVLYMTDAWVEEHGVQNPAIYDCFPKFIRNSLRGEGDTMPRTIRKMTGGVADRFSIPERGYVKPGYFADLTVFDEAEMVSAVPDQEKAFGIRRVFINGKEVLCDGRLAPEALKTSGHALRSR
ncbi:MAG: amidohydrolase family protein [Bacteroidales bacterium]|nr:amidohydrolase family protein [Bacteroidales bacterium]MBR1794912.1 amidohydrolase family protein [Bacteroidales bacterium]